MAGCKIKHQIISLLCTSHTSDKERNLASNSIHTCLKRYFGINLTNEEKDLTNENFKTDERKHSQRWEDFLGSQVGRGNIVKMTIFRMFFTFFCFYQIISRCECQAQLETLSQGKKMECELEHPLPSFVFTCVRTGTCSHVHTHCRHRYSQTNKKN